MPIKISVSGEGGLMYECHLLPAASEEVTPEQPGYPNQLVVVCDSDDKGGIVYRGMGNESDGTSDDREAIIANNYVETVIGLGESYERFIATGAALLTLTISHYVE